jgi:hypothetical protein
MLNSRLPKEVVCQIFEYVYGMPAENKQRLILQINSYRKRFEKNKNVACYNAESIDKIYHDIQFRVIHRDIASLHYTRTDEPFPYEYYYMGDVLEADTPRIQLYQYKRYVRQLEKKIKTLEQQLQKQQK